MSNQVQHLYVPGHTVNTTTFLNLHILSYRLNKLHSGLHFLVSAFRLPEAPFSLD